MKSNKQMVEWCLKQQRGIKLDKPNPTLCKEYLRKSRGSLKMLGAALETEETEWVAITAYYARYDAVYALFQKCGIISEIHDCTIAAFACLFVEEGIVGKSLHEELVFSKERRIEAQYYVGEEPETDLNEDAKKARTFVLNIEEALDKLEDDKIEKIRRKLEKML